MWGRQGHYVQIIPWPMILPAKFHAQNEPDHALNRFRPSMSLLQEPPMGKTPLLRVGISLAQQWSATCYVTEAPRPDAAGKRDSIVPTSRRQRRLLGSTTHMRSQTEPSIERRAFTSICCKGACM